MIGKVKKAKLYIFVGRLAKPHTVELGTSRLKGDGTNGNPLTDIICERPFKIVPLANKTRADSKGFGFFQISFFV